MENTVTISLGKYEEFKIQEKRIEELKRLLEEKSVVVEHFYKSSIRLFPEHTRNYKLKDYESIAIEENQRLYNELTMTKEQLGDLETSYSNKFEELEDVKHKNIFQLIKWWYNNRNK